MTKITVIYESRTGNTERMANLIAEGAREEGEVEVRQKEVRKASKEDVEWCEGLAVGTPTHCGLMSWRLKRFFDEEMIDLWGEVKQKVGTAFSSSGGLGGGNELAAMSVLNSMLNYGFLVFGTPDYAGEGVTGHYGAVAVGEPGEKEEEMCKVLGRKLVRRARTIRD